MNRQTKTIFFALYVLLLSACATTQQRKTFTPQSAEADQSAIYIYRPSVASNAMYAPDLYIDDEYKLEIKNGKKARIILTPGSHTLELEPGGNYTGLTRIPMMLAAGKTYYIRVDTTLKINSASTFEPYQRNFNLINVDAPIATGQIAECCLNEKNVPAAKKATEEKNENGQFSVDKTQNPFSH